jgi:radical SAM superfamily enzyme YgiQ (UPF0313 family)
MNTGTFVSGEQPAGGKPVVFPLALANEKDILPYLSIGMVAAYLRVYDDQALNASYFIERVRIGGVPGHSLEEAYAGIAEAPRSVCLLSSYVWNNHVNLAAAKDIKALAPSSIIIIGGPEVPKYVDETEAFLEKNPAIDIAVLGEGEVACAQILEILSQTDYSLDSLANVEGIVFRGSDGWVRTGDRERIANINELPSPYLTGEFEPWFDGFTSAILETNRGCPYGCTYCDWGSATLAKVTKFEPVRVNAEIDYIAKKGSQAVFVADANFGMLEQDIELAQTLVDAKAKYGFPVRMYSNFAKNGGRRLMAVIKILHEGGLLEAGIIALQTTDDDVLKAIKRDNIKTSSYEKLMGYFNSENIPMASDIMIGLPGQTIDSLQKDLQFCFDWKVSANGNYTSMMPNAPMAEKTYREEFQIVADDDGMIASTSTFTAEDLMYMKCMYMIYQFHVPLGHLKYYLYFLQMEHGLQAIAVLRRWLDRVLEGDSRLSLSSRLYWEVLNPDGRTGDWALLSWGDEAEFFFEIFEDYLAEFHRFVVDEFGLIISETEIAALLGAQAAVIPRPGRNYPYAIDLPHNVVNYFAQYRNVAAVSELEGKLKALRDFQPHTFKVNPFVKPAAHVRFVKQNGHSDAWELLSPLRFNRNRPKKAAVEKDLIAKELPA